MKPKNAVKIAVDGLMTVGLLFLMGYQFWDGAPHEWAGAGLFLLFILHHILNGNWYRALFKGRYTPYRMFQTLVGLLVFLAMAGLMVSGVILSNHVFGFLPIRGGMSFARLLHMAASYWGFVLMALHLGLHWGMLAGMVKNALKIRRASPLRKVLLPVLGGGIAAYGLVEFIRRDFLSYMLVRTHFVFLDYSETFIGFYLDYLAMMGTFIFLGYYGGKLLRKLAGRGKRKR